MKLTEYLKACFGFCSVTPAQISDATGQSRQNFSNKLKRNDMRLSELIQIADVLDCDLEIAFVKKQEKEPLMGVRALIEMPLKEEKNE